MSESYGRVVDLIQRATVGFDHLFSDEMVDAKSVFQADDSSLHLLGLGVCSFLEASLAMEVRLGELQSNPHRYSRLCKACIDGRSECYVDQCGGTGQETTQGCIEDQ